MSPLIPFFSEEHIETRDMLVGQFTRHLKGVLAKVNNAFHFIRIETPTLITSALRKQTAPNAVQTIADFLNSHSVKYRLPLVIWEYGKVYTPSERTHLEYQIFFSKTTATQYLPIIQESACHMLGGCGEMSVITSLCERTDLWADGRQIEFIIDMDACAETYLENVNNGRITATKKSGSGN